MTTSGSPFHPPTPIFETHENGGLYFPLDSFKRFIDVIGYFAVPKSQDSISPRNQECCPFLIVFDLILVRVSVKFNDQLNPGCAKIHHIISDWVLPPKMNSVQLMITQLLPESTFGFCLLFPQEYRTLSGVDGSSRWGQWISLGGTSQKS